MVSHERHMVQRHHAKPSYQDFRGKPSVDVGSRLGSFCATSVVTGSRKRSPLADKAGSRHAAAIGKDGRRGVTGPHG